MEAQERSNMEEQWRKGKRNNDDVGKKEARGRKQK